MDSNDFGYFLFTVTVVLVWVLGIVNLFNL